MRVAGHQSPVVEALTSIARRAVPVVGRTHLEATEENTMPPPAAAAAASPAPRACPTALTTLTAEAKVGFYQDPDDTARACAAYDWTRPPTSVPQLRGMMRTHPWKPASR